MTVDRKFSPRCFLDIEIDGEKAGRIIVELFATICPITCENFRALCTGEKGVGKTTNKPLHYKGAPFHRVVKNFVIQGGDFVAGNGTGGESIYGGQFKDENFDIPHDKPFLLSMSNRGKDSNGSQFFITTHAAPHLNGKHTVFGQVLEGHEVVSKIESIKTDPSCRPTKDVKISNCGELVLKIKQKERKPKLSESSDSESGEAKEKMKKKKKHKHTKKHKRERREDRDSNVSIKKEDDVGCMVDPEEIPSVPINNFLMRRTSPMGDGNRSRPAPRESFNYHRPSRSRSGRKIKGRGFMRYRTPSRSASRSGSETPPHWKQAQARLKNIKDVVLPAKEPIAPEDSESANEEVDESGPRANFIQSRLGMVSKSSGDLKQKDARAIMRENRRNREWSPDGSPPPKGKGGRGWSAGSPLRSTVVVTSNFSKDSEEKPLDHHGYRKSGGRRNQRESSPERRTTDRFDRDRKYPDRRPGQDSRGPLQNRREFGGASPQKSSKHDTFRGRKEPQNDSTDEKWEGPKGRQRRSDQRRGGRSDQNVRGLAQFRYRTDLQNSSDDSSEKEEVQEKVKRKEPERSGPSQKVYASLANELFKYRKDAIPSESSESEDQAAPEPGATTAKSVPVVVEPVPVDTEREVSAEPSKVVIPGIDDDTVNGISPTVEDDKMEVEVGKIEEPPEQNVDNNSKAPEEATMQPNSIKEFVTAPIVSPAKEKRRWDMQESEVVKPRKTIDLQNFETVTNFDCRLPDVIPLPEETRTDIDPTGDRSAPKGLFAESGFHPVEDVIKSRSKSPDSDDESQSLQKAIKSTREIEKPQTLDQKHSSDPIEPRKISKSRSRSPSPKGLVTRNRSKSPVGRSKRRVSESSPERKSTAKKSRQSPDRLSKSPSRPGTSRRNRSGRRSKSRSGSRSNRRSVSRDRVRRRRSRSRSLNTRSRRSLSRERGSRFQRYSGIRNRSPDHRGSFQRRYGKSPSYRGRARGARNSRSRSVDRHRRRGRASSSSSDSSSSKHSSSSRNGRRKKDTDKRRRKGRKQSTSSSSSSRSKRSKSSAST